MAVIAIALTDNAPVPIRWELPPGPSQIRSVVPVGLLVFTGSGAVTAKGAGDETNLTIALTMPGGVAFIPRNMMVSVTSADTVNEFELVGTCDIITIPMIPGATQNPRFNMLAPGFNFAAAAVKQIVWVPDRGAIKPVMPADSIVTFNFADMDAGATSAATARWYTDFYVFELDQIDKWQINTPTPVTFASSF